MELQKLNHRHDQIAEWLVVNGDKTLTECAKHYGYTLPWMSQIVNSDMFQALYLELCNDRKVAAVHTVRNKMSNAASLAIDKIIDGLKDDLPGGPDPMEAAELMLDRLGFSPKSNGNGNNGQAAGGDINNNYYLTPDELRDARERARDERTVVVNPVEELTE